MYKILERCPECGHMPHERYECIHIAMMVDGYNDYCNCGAAISLQKEKNIKYSLSISLTGSNNNTVDIKYKEMTEANIDDLAKYLKGKIRN